MEERSHTIVLSARPEEVRAALPTAVEGWGGEWQAEGSGGLAHLPVRYGLRYGTLVAEIALEHEAHGTFVTLRERDEELRLHTAAVAVLLFAALSAVAIVLWPLFPALTSLVPLALVLGVAAWLLVVSRLRTAGSREFLQWLKDCTENRGQRH